MVIDLDCSGLDISSSHPIFFGFHPIPLPSPSSSFFFHKYKESRRRTVDLNQDSNFSAILMGLAKTNLTLEILRLF